MVMIRTLSSEVLIGINNDIYEIGGATSKNTSATNTASPNIAYMLPVWLA